MPDSIRFLISFISLVALLSCKSSAIDMDNLACADDACLPGYACHPFDDVCVHEIEVGCDSDASICPSTVSEGSDCAHPGSFIPCSGDSATDCSTGCRTCDQDGEWGPCAGGGNCTLGTVAACATCDDDCLTTVLNSTAVFCDTSTGSNECAYDTCLSGYDDADGARANGCECRLGGGNELCNNIDDDCNGIVDDIGPVALTTQCEMLSGDPSHVATWSCIAGTCTVVTGNCDIGWWDINGEGPDGCEYQCTPAAPPSELCNGDDEDCNGVVDDVIDLKSDCDSRVSDPQNVVTWQCPAEVCEIQSCSPGWTNANNNVDDGCENECTPDPPERCNGNDDDCNGVTDEVGAQGCTRYYRDEDRDGVGMLSDMLCLCAANGFYDTTVTDDCDDGDVNVFPGGTEVCDDQNVDEDCDGGADNDDPEGATDALLYYRDTDGDGYGDDTDTTGTFACDAVGLVANQSDCDDNNGNINPDAQETLSAGNSCNDVDDNDCDGLADGLDPGCNSGDAWWDCALGFRRRIVIDHTRVVADLSDFPVLISLPGDSDLAADAQDDGDDIAFASEDGSTQYSHELEAFDGSDGNLVAWAKVPTLSSSVDTVLYLYYGAGGGNRENVADVWSNGYQAVYHLHDDFADSTGDHNAANSNSIDVAGQMADGQEVEPSDGSADHIDLGSWSVTGNQLTIQAWIRIEEWTHDEGRIISKANGTVDNSHVFMLSTVGSSAHRLRLRIKTGTNDNSGTTTLVADSGDIGSGIWYLAAGTYDGATMRLLLDGLDSGSTGKTGNLRSNGWDVWAGDNPNASRELDGILDEVRISSAARPAAWLRTEFNNQATPATFHAIESEEARPLTCP